MKWIILHFYKLKVQIEFINTRKPTNISLWPWVAHLNRPRSLMPNITKCFKQLCKIVHMVKISLMQLKKQECRSVGHNKVTQGEHRIVAYDEHKINTLPIVF